MTSQALSAAPATMGRPAGMPVSSAAWGVTVPITVPGCTSSGSMDGRTGRACHFQSCGGAQRPFL
jgi:hypothetical protein